MAQTPFPMGDVNNIKEAIYNLQMATDDLYQNRLGGANVGDVFTTDAEDVLTLGTGKGVEKSGNKVIAKGNATKAVTVSDSGIEIMAKAGFGIVLDPVAGLALNQQGAITPAVAVTQVVVLTGVDHINLVDLNTKLGTLKTELDAIKTVINNIITVLHNLEATA